MENDNYLNEMLHKKSELPSTLTKCQSLINLQRLVILREYNIKNPDMLEKYFLNDDSTNKLNIDVINNRIKKNIFNVNNYEQNIKSQAWQKDLSKMFLSLNDDNKEKNENGFFEYNYTNRNKKKEKLIFIRNFFGKMKSAKKTKNRFNKRNHRLYNKDKYDNYKYRNKREEKSENKNNEMEINKIWDKISSKYKKNYYINENNLNDNKDNYDYNIKYLTEIRSNKSNNNLDMTKNKNNNSKNIKIKNNIFPQIITSNSTKNINNKKRMNNINTYKIKKFREQLKMIYKGKYKYMTLNNDKKKDKNFDMPELLEDRKIPLFKKNNKVFLSPLHFSKFEQMNEIKNKLIKVGFLDKDVFKIYNKNV